MKLKMCLYVGCMNPTENNYCAEHQQIIDARRAAQKKIFTQRGQSSAYNNLYQTARWRAERKQFLIEHPYCYLCGAPAKIVDHARAHHGDLELFWDHNNWQPMCMSCHSAKTFHENNYFKKADR